MSLFTESSLCLVPSGVKDGKVYSIKPTDGSGDLTFTRSNDTATRVASNGLIEKVRTNVLLQSNSFDTTWVNTNTTETSGQAGYDGTSNAWLIDKSAASGKISQTISTSALVTFSLYAKANTLNWIAILYDGVSGGQAYFDLQNGVIGSQGAGVLNHTITAVGSGWYRIKTTTSSASSGISIFPADANNNVSGTSGNILIQAAQLETGDIATDYIATTTAAVSVGPVANLPRLDYSGGASCPRLLLEPQRQNVCLWSEQMGNWGQSRGTITANAVASPDGYTNADLWAQNGGETTAAALLQNISVTSGTAYSLSVFAKKQNKNFLGIRANSVSSTPSYFDLENGTLGDINPLHTAKIEDYGNGWHRCSISYTTSSTSAGHIFYPTDGSSLTVTDSGGIYLYGAQLEASASYASSYVNTLNSAVTRGLDAASKTGISSLIGQTEGTIYIEVNTNQHISELSDNTSANRIVFYTDGSDYLRNLIRASASTSSNIQTNTTIQAGDKIALAYANNDAVIYKNGVQIGSDTSVTIPATSKINVGSDYSEGLSTTNSVNQVLLFKTRLSNADLAALTA